MRINKILTYGFIAAFGLSAFTACATKTESKVESSVSTETESANAKTTEGEGKKIKVVSTIFPSYDWAKEVVGDLKDSYDFTLLLDKGTDLHSYQPTADDIAKIAEADLFIYVGGESDGWVDDALKVATNKDMKVINLVEVLGDKAKTEEVVEGMQAEEEEEHSGEIAEGGEACEENEIDEHVWLSLKNASTYVKSIEEALADIDKKNAATYEKNAAAYISKLNDLDKEYKDVVDASTNKTVLFGDRFPFRYLVDDYGLKYYAAFVGCSAETEASFNTVVFLANKVDELNLGDVLTIENSDGKIAKTIIDNTKDKNKNVDVLNSMQSVTAKDVESGETYLKIMQSNLEVLKKVLK